MVRTIFDNGGLNRLQCRPDRPHRLLKLLEHFDVGNS